MAHITACKTATCQAAGETESYLFNLAQALMPEGPFRGRTVAPDAAVARCLRAGLRLSHLDGSATAIAAALE